MHCNILLFLVAVNLSFTLSLSTNSNSNGNGSNNIIMQKTIKEICRKPPSHWVGDGFHGEYQYQVPCTRKQTYYLYLEHGCTKCVSNNPDAFIFFIVYPVFANKAFTKELSPFLMFDYAAPKTFPGDGKKRGVGKHPHRGFETVTIAFQGEVEHGDSRGNKGVIGPGDVQWMTAAKGIVHEEFHSTEFAKNGGTFEMCQVKILHSLFFVCFTFFHLIGYLIIFSLGLAKYVVVGELTQG